MPPPLPRFSGNRIAAAPSYHQLNKLRSWATSPSPSPSPSPIPPRAVISARNALGAASTAEAAAAPTAKVAEATAAKVAEATAAEAASGTTKEPTNPIGQAIRRDIWGFVHQTNPQFLFVGTLAQPASAMAPCCCPQHMIPLRDGSGTPQLSDSVTHLQYFFVPLLPAAGIALGVNLVMSFCYRPSAEEAAAFAYENRKRGYKV